MGSHVRYRPIADIVERPIKRYRCAVAKRFTINELEPVAREATRKALEGVQKSFDLYQNDPNLTLGTIVEDDVATFQLYLAGATPADAVVLTAARVSRETGKLLGVEICFEDPAA
ncbi:hypothetical protein SKP52_11350 [Sphingopyxis fribergensis]|uniref:Uncharacterized protein n=1 Tax=Sphingopyxis fribergensis TaxID=1515612 RepID=A0A0A7PGU0_9SPHN|nr:hypothetical protein SKP52_11350 [Sphingopyxis fribergensis]